MSYRYIQDEGPSRESRCEFERTLKGEYCPEDGGVGLDGLTLCERHADRLRLEERLTYWRAILAHVELWSGEACRLGRCGAPARGRARVLAELERAKEVVDGHHEEHGSDDGRAPPLWKPLFLLGGAVIG